MTGRECGEAGVLSVEQLAQMRQHAAHKLAAAAGMEKHIRINVLMAYLVLVVMTPISVRVSSAVQS
jgi:hypothetical protein